MKKLLVFAAIFALFSTFATAQTTTTTPKKAKTAKKMKSHTAKAATATAPVTISTPAAAPAKGAVATFETIEMDYGKIKQGSEPLRLFTFKNTGSEPLIISGAQGSCGCTVPTYPKEPIMPGQSSKIEVRYDTQRLGPFTKSVTLTTNEANPTRVLTIKGDVENSGAQTPVATDVQNH